MKQNLLLMTLLVIAAGVTFGQTPLSMNGRLKIVGTQLSNECGSAVQLRGMSTHAVAAHFNCLKESSIKALAEDWKADLLRLAVYTESAGVTPGYTNPNTDKNFWHNWIDEMVRLTEKYGMYVIIDWHILSDNDPNKHINDAKSFFTLMSQKYASKKHVLYEICNEPNSGVSWGTIKNYANQIIPLIRANDPNNIIIVGTPDWSSRPDLAANDPISGTNIMYSFHFYAASHTNDTYRGYFNNAINRVPVFVTEWGTTDASGGNSVNTGNSDQWITMMNNAKVSWANWSFSDVPEASAALTAGACGTDSWNSRSTSGNYIYQKMSSPDSFTQCASAADDDKDGVPNSTDACPGTPEGLTVNASGCHDSNDNDNDGVINARDLCPNSAPGSVVNNVGCAITQEFVSNVCVGFNNKQGYARHDFSVDSIANVEFWNRPWEKSPVYSATTSGGQLVVAVTGGDPNYTTMGFSFGERATGNSTELIPLDIRAHPVVKMDVNFQASNYSSNTVLFDIQLEDADGNSVSTDATGNLHRYQIPLNTTRTIEASFKNGYRQSYEAADCGNLNTPCYVRNFDFSKVTKIKVWVNPGAGESWSRPAFTGTMRIDNFSVGYNSSVTAPCDQIRDDDGDGVKEEDDLCKNTPAGAQVDANGCGQLDDDNDGVTNNNDRCPNTAANATVDAFGCSNEQLNADDDGDGIKNGNDICPDTPADETADSNGCSDSQRDDDNDGTPNGQDGCPNDPNKIAEGNCGCGTPESGCTIDCAGVKNGTAYRDNCNECVGGTTGKEACVGNPYNNQMQEIPGIIQAEYYDLGGQGVGFSDTDNNNQGGQFRNDGVDIENCEGSSTNWNIGYTEPNEWLQYAVKVVHSGTYTISFRIASQEGNGRWRLEMDGQPLPGTTLSAVNTNGWQNYTMVTTSQPVYLQAGNHSLRFVVEAAGFNIDNMDFVVNVISANQDARVNKVEVYPVPATDMLTILQHQMNYNQAVISDITGTVVKVVSLKNLKEELTVDTLPKGVYLIQLTGNDKSEVLRVVVQ